MSIRRYIDILNEAFALRPIEISALEFVEQHGGSVLISKVPDKSMSDELGQRLAGLPTYQRLDKMGLVVITQEDEDENGFAFTQAIELTPEGKAALAQARGH